MEEITYEIPTINTVPVPLIKIGDQRYCLNHSLCAITGYTRPQLSMVLKRNRNRLNPIGLFTICERFNLQTFLREHKRELGLGHIHPSILLWPLRDAMKVAMRANTEQGWDFADYAFEQMIKDIQFNTVSKEEFMALTKHYDAVLAQYEQRFSQLEAERRKSVAGRNRSASAIGVALHAQRYTKPPYSMH